MTNRRIFIEKNLDKALSYSCYVRELCQPLFLKTKLSYFNFSRKYHDGSNVSLSTHPEWTKYYYTSELYNPVDEGTDIELLKKRELDAGFRRFFRFEFDDCPAGRVCRDDYGLTTSLTLVMLSDSYYDCYFFGAGAGENVEYLMSLHTQYPEIFSRFVFYFHEQCKDIIDDLVKERNRILIPDKKVKLESLVNAGVSQFEIDKKDIDELINLISPSKFRMVIHDHEVFLTLREAQCTSLWLRGNAVKKIAAELGLSARTVETHLEKVKQKLNCNSKSEVVNMLVGRYDDSRSKNRMASNMSLIESIIWR